jgi:putative Mn2+ efflux pump MntP
MNAAALGLMAFSMPMDAIAVAPGKTAEQHYSRLVMAMYTGLIVGPVIATTPVGRRVTGIAVDIWITGLDDWLAFTMLGVLSLTAVAASLEAKAIGIIVVFAKISILTAAAGSKLEASETSTIGRATGRRMDCGAEIPKRIRLIGIGGTGLIDHTCAT